MMGLLSKNFQKSFEKIFTIESEFIIMKPHP